MSPEIKFTENELKKAKSKQGVYASLNKEELNLVNSVLVRHVFRLIKIAFMEYTKNNEVEWSKFREILKRTL